MDMTRFILLLLLCPVVICGCGKRVQIEESQPLCLVPIDREQFMEIAEDALVRMYFVIEKYDVNAGFIKTKPLRGAQFFEFWRKDNTSFKKGAESNIHSIQRIVQMTVDQGEQGLCMKCNVKVQRLSIPEEEFLVMSRVQETFSEKSSSIQSLRVPEKKQSQMTWIDIGDDPVLETKILDTIERKFAKMQRKKKKWLF
ncbi:MAG: hypothetical protein JW912_06575 [Sedimentisphaerales bacterium]|nr:hypothetical protein [Sedimentisphaerales bacterium]